jgi:uncharacterized protein
MITRYVRLLERIYPYRYPILAAAAVVWVLLGLSAIGISIDEDVMSLLPETRGVTGSYKDLLRYFDPMERMYIEVGTTETGDEKDGGIGEEERAVTDEVMFAAADLIAERCEDSGLFRKVMYRWDFSQLEYTLQTMRTHRGALTDPSDLAEILHLASAEELRSTLEEWIRLLSESPDPFSVTGLQTDPFGFDAILTDKFDAAGTGADGVTVRNGRLYSTRTGRALIIAFPIARGTDSGAAEGLIEFSERVFREAEERYPGIRVSYLSGHRFSLENARRIKRDIAMTVSVSLGAIILLSLLAYSRPYLVLLVLLPAFFGGALSLGILRWLVPGISAIIAGCGAMLIGISVDYGIHLLYHADSAGHGRRIAAVAAGIAKPLLVSAGTTLSAFLILQFSILPGYRNLGLFVGFGIIGAALFTLTVLPMLVPKPGKRRPILAVDRFFRRYLPAVRNHRIPVLACTALFTVLMIPGIFRLQIDGDVSNLNAASPEMRDDMARVVETFGSATASTLLAVQGSTLSEALAENERLAAVLREATERELVASFVSLAELLPSPETQARNYERWERTLETKLISDVTSRLRNLAEEMRIRPQYFDDYLDSLSAPFMPVTASTYAGTVLETLVAGQIALPEDGDGAAMILTTAAVDGADDLETLRTMIADSGVEAISYNGTYFAGEVVGMIFGEMRRLGALAAAVVALFLMFYARRPLLIAALLVPLAVSLVWTFGLLGWMNIRINVINSIVVIFIFGLVIDYCVFLATACREMRIGNPDLLHSAEITGGAVTISAFTTIFGLGALALARHPALHSLGITAVIAIAGGLTAVMLIIPAIYYPATSGKEMLAEGGD